MENGNETNNQRTCNDANILAEMLVTCSTGYLLPGILRYANRPLSRPHVSPQTNPQSVSCEPVCEGTAVGHSIASAVVMAVARGWSHAGKPTNGRGATGCVGCTHYRKDWYCKVQDAIAYYQEPITQRLLAPDITHNMHLGVE